MSNLAMSHDELSQLPPVLDLGTAARVLGITRHKAYEMVRSGAWPTRVLKLGRTCRVPTADLLTLIGVPADPQEVRPAS